MTRRVAKAVQNLEKVTKQIVDEATSNRFEVREHVIPGSTRLVQVGEDDPAWEKLGAVYEIAAGAFIVLEPGETRSQDSVDKIVAELKRRGALEVFVRAIRRGKLVPDAKAGEEMPKTKSVREHATQLLDEANSKNKPALAVLVETTLAKRGF